MAGHQLSKNKHDGLSALSSYPVFTSVVCATVYTPLSGTLSRSPIQLCDRCEARLFVGEIKCLNAI